MRCWIGIELEHNGNYGEKTLFVEGESINLNIVNELANKYSVRSIYLGAGEIDLHNIIGDIELLSSYYVTLETNKVFDVTKYLAQYVNKLVIRTDTLDLDNLSNVSFKYRLKDEIGISDSANFVRTDIAKVIDGKYPTDIMVYDDKEEL